MKKFGELTVCPRGGKTLSETLNILFGDKDSTDIIAIFPTGLSHTDFKIITVQKIPNPPKPNETTGTGLDQPSSDE